MVKVGFIVPGSGEAGTGGGTNDHSALGNRNLPNQHIISSITGLQETLNGLKTVNFQYNDKTALISANPKKIDTLYITKDNKVYRYNETTYIELFTFAENPIVLIEQNDDKTKLIVTYFNGTKDEFTVVGTGGGSSSLELDTVSATSIAWNSNPEVEIDIVDGKISFNFKIPVGASAYDIAINNGFSGNEVDWLAALIGDDGKTAYQLALDNGFTGSEVDWLNSLKGESAYGLAVSLGFVGTEEEWINSLQGTSYSPSNVDVLEKLSEQDGKLLYDGQLIEGGVTGTQGPPGKSAYDVAVDDGFIGTEAEWLESLQGPPYTPDNADILAKLNEENGKLLYDNTVIGTGIEEAPDDGEIYGRIDKSWKILPDIAQSVNLLFLSVEDSKAVITHEKPILEQMILPITYFGVEPSTWQEILTIESGKDIQHIELEFIPGNRFSAKIWIRSDVLRDNAQIRIQAISKTDDVILAAATNVIDLNNDNTILIPVVFEGIHEELRVLPISNIKIIISIMVQEFGAQIGIITRPPNEISYIAHMTTNTVLGKDGLSAYQIWLNNGNVGTEQEFLNSLIGLPGEDGKSAYDLAVDNGFEGTEQEWLASLQGSLTSVELDNIDILKKIGEQNGELTYDNKLVGTEVEQYDDTIIKEEIEELSNAKMNHAPITDKVYGGMGEQWVELENVEKRAVILIEESINFTENNHIIEIDPDNFDENDLFTVEYNGAQVSFVKNSSVKILTGIGYDKKLYKFIFDDTLKIITIEEIIEINQPEATNLIEPKDLISEDKPNVLKLGSDEKLLVSSSSSEGGTGFLMFSIEDEHLMLYYDNRAQAENFSVNENGHLIYSFD